MTSVSVSLWKMTPSSMKPAFEDGIIFDDAIVHDGDLAVAAGDVGMGVAVGGGAVRRPAGMADALTAGSGLFSAENASRSADPAGFLAQMQMPAGRGRHAGAVVAAIFQPSKPSSNIGSASRLADVSDDATHSSPCSECEWSNVGREVSEYK